MINQNILKNFLKEAKVNTYAKSGEGGEKELKDGGKRFEYRKGDLYYRDIYYGYSPFAGEEVLFYKKQPVWVMSYYGKVTSKSSTSKNIYKFLKEALGKTPTDKPFRGPKSFKNGDFKYKNFIKGNIGRFDGTEIIFCKDKWVYKLNYFGGMIE